MVSADAGNDVVVNAGQSFDPVIGLLGVAVKRGDHLLGALAVSRRSFFKARAAGRLRLRELDSLGCT
jgi:hypothetical protein